MLRLLHGQAEAMTTCLYCPKLCRHACPVSEISGREAVTPWALMSRGALIHQGLLPLSQDTAVQWAHCTGCGRCTAACKHEIPVADAIRGARAEAAAGGLIPEGHKGWPEAEPPARPSLEALAEGGEVLLVAGWASAAECEAAARWIAACVGQIPGRPAGGRFSAGARWAEVGQPAQGQIAAESLAEACAGADRIVCLDLEDAVALQARGLAAIHLSDLIVEAEIVEAKPPEAGPRAWLVGGCRLPAEGRGRIEALLTTAGIAWGRAPADRRASVADLGPTCCGAGGGLAAASPALAAEMAEALITPPPWCAEAPPRIIVADGRCAGHIQPTAPTGSPPVIHWSVALLEACPEIGGGPDDERNA